MKKISTQDSVTVIIFIYVGTYYEKRWTDKFPADAPIYPRLLAQHCFHILRKSLQACAYDERSVTLYFLHCKFKAHCHSTTTRVSSWLHVYLSDLVKVEERNSSGIWLMEMRKFTLNHYQGLCIS
jgi:hypothetical protein